MSVAEHIAEILLRTKAVKLAPKNPFKWSSGWLSPIYCDNRVTLSYPKERKYITTELAAMINERFPNCTAIAGVATAGIAQGALVAELLGLPFVYVRPEPKKHGMGNQLEGRLDSDAQVVILEDLISTGGSSLKVVDVLRSMNHQVLGMAAIFTYGFELADRNFAEKNLTLAVLSNYGVLIKQAIDNNYVSSTELDTLEAWREAPEIWSN